MEENPKHLRKKAKGKTRRIMNPKTLKNKYEMFNSEINRWNSCNNLINFVPRITPKKPYCKPSLFVLNPDMIHKQNSQVGFQKHLIFEEDSNSLELSFESSKDENNKNNIGENNINKKESDKKLEINQNQDLNIENINIESDICKENCNKYDSGEYVTILDILSMKHNDSNL